MYGKKKVGGMQMVRRFRLVAFLAVLLLGLVATAASPVAAGTVYTDSKGRFKSQIADGWSSQPPPDGFEAVFTVDGGAALFTVGHDDVTDGKTNVDYATDYAKFIQGKQLQDYKEVDRYFFKCFSSDQCPVLDYTVTDVDGKTQRVAHVFFTNGTDAWVLTYRTLASNFSTYLDDLNFMLGSFTI